MHGSKNSSAYQLNLPRSRYWVLFFTLLGLTLRLYRLSFQPLWGDEGWSFYFATQSPAQLIALTAIDIHPPLYYLLLQAWLALVGIGPETARLFSVGTGTLLIPALAILGRRLYGARLGALAAGVTALMPLAIYYAQEVRMYGLVTLLGILSIYFLVRLVDHQTLAPGRRLFWLGGYVITTTAALYTMYYAAFIVLLELIYLLLRLWRQPDRPALRAVTLVLRPFMYVGLLYLPWLIYATPRLINYVQNKRDVEGYEPLSLLQFLGSHLMAFSLGHLSDTLQPYALWIGLPLLLVALIGLGAALFSRARSRWLLYLYLCLPLLLGYAINQLFPFTPRFFERTLLLAAPAYWLLIALGLAWLSQRQRLLTALAGLAMLVAITLSLFDFYHWPRYPHQDYRPLLQDIAARATPADTLLASYQWQLGFYRAYLSNPRPQLFPVPGWGRDWSTQATAQPRLVADLQKIFGRSPRLWFPAYQASGHIWEDEAEAAIARLGYPALLEWYSPQTKLTLAGAPHQPLVAAPPANFEQRLALSEAAIGPGPYQAGRDIIPLKLVWHKLRPLGSAHRVSLRLIDPTGRTWTSRDSFPRAGQAHFTDLAIDESLVDHHGLLTPAGAPPGVYQLMLSVRQVSDAHPLDLVDSAGQPQGAELKLADIELVSPNPPLGPAALPIQTPVKATFAQAARLLGYSLGAGPFKIGESLPLTLFWEALADRPSPLLVELELQDAAGTVIPIHHREPLWPSSVWQAGLLLRDPHEVRLPASLAPGHYQLSLALSTPDQGRLAVAGGHSLPLTAVTIADRPHSFDPPSPQIELGVDFGQQASLVGLDLPQTSIKPGQTLPVTLYWQAQAPFEKNWTVFVHLTDEAGQIVSQQDQIPGGGQFPTPGWVPEEYLVDSYNLLIPPDTPPGQMYTLKIGLYEASDRLPVTEAGEPVTDHLTLERWPIVVE